MGGARELPAQRSMFQMLRKVQVHYYIRLCNLYMNIILLYVYTWMTRFTKGKSSIDPVVTTSLLPPLPLLSYVHFFHPVQVCDEE